MEVYDKNFFKTLLIWLTELQKTAQHVVHVCQSARSRQFQREISTQLMLASASTAEHAQALAQWVLS